MIMTPGPSSPSGRATRKQTMQEIIKLRFDGQVLAKKNRHMVAKIGNHAFVKPDKEAQANEADMVQQFRIQLMATKRRLKAIQTKERRVLEAKASGETYEIDITITQPNMVRRDLDNQASTIMDALTKAGAIADDCWQFVRKITVQAGGVSKTPGADITITINQGR